MPKYKVYWDNGAHACGTFPTVFDTYEDAEAYGDDWVAMMKVPDDDDDETSAEGTYTYEVIEVEE